MTENEKKLRLFVIGELSGDPDDWIPWNPYRAIVIAHDEEEARRLVDCCTMIAEIPFVRPVKLMSESAADGL